MKIQVPKFNNENHTENLQALHWKRAIKFEVKVFYQRMKLVFFKKSSAKKDHVTVDLLILTHFFSLNYNTNPWQLFPLIFWFWKSPKTPIVVGGNTKWVRSHISTQLVSIFYCI